MIMDKNVLVSVIIPVYNTEKYIEETIDSVLKQTHSNLEIIVIDDGSTDNTSQLVDAICKKESRVKLIKQKNQGVSAARNNGFTFSKGSFIAYLDADDVWETNNIETKLKKFNSDELLGLVHSDAQVINNISEKIDRFHHGYEGYLLDNLLLGQKEWIPSPSSILVKREIIESIGGFDSGLSNAADLDFFFKVAEKWKIGRVPVVTWYYRIHSNNMHSNIRLFEKDILTLYKKADAHKLFKTLSFRRKCYSNLYFMLAGSIWVHGNNKIKAIKYLAMSIIYYPPTVIRIIEKTLG